MVNYKYYLLTFNPFVRLPVMADEIGTPDNTDTVVIRFAIEDSRNTRDSIPNLAEKLNFNFSPVTMESKLHDVYHVIQLLVEPTDQNALQTSLGRRSMQEIRFERYTSQSTAVYILNNYLITYRFIDYIR